MAHQQLNFMAHTNNDNNPTTVSMATVSNFTLIIIIGSNQAIHLNVHVHVCMVVHMHA